MGDWNVFFAACAGGAATLAGLIFVATQLHEGTFADPTNRWTALAQSTLALLSSVLVLSLAYLVPGFTLEIRAYLTLTVCALVLLRTVRIWWPVVRIGKRGSWRRLRQSFWLLILPVAIYLYLLFGAFELLSGDHNDGYLTAAGTFLSIFGVSVRNSWRLVSAAQRED